jgi:hypothetical protein
MHEENVSFMLLPMFFGHLELRLMEHPLIIINPTFCYERALLSLLIVSVMLAVYYLWSLTALFFRWISSSKVPPDREYRITPLHACMHASSEGTGGCKWEITGGHFKCIFVLVRCACEIMIIEEMVEVNIYRDISQLVRHVKIFISNRNSNSLT